MLFDRLIFAFKRFKKIKSGIDPLNLLFEISSMKRNNISKIFAESATLIDPEAVHLLLEQGFIQPVLTEDIEKYALTFKGIAYCINLRYEKTLEEQYNRFLELLDRKFAALDYSQLQPKEKVASLSLILLASISEASAIFLTNKSNKAVLTEVFEKTLNCLKKFGVVGKNETVLRTVSRGESPVSALMSRLDKLPRKTNHYFRYTGKGSGYFFDIEENGDVNEKKLFFLLRRIYERYDLDVDYTKMYKELAEISQLYSSRFLGRTTNPVISISILEKLKKFLEEEILHLPPKPQHTLVLNK